MPAPLANREQLMDTVKALWLSGLRDDRIIEQTGVKLGTLKTWIHRYSWNELRIKVRDSVNTGVAKVVGESLERQSNAVRRSLGAFVERAANEMDASKISAKSLGNSSKRQGQAAIVKTLAESAEKVFGWDNNSKSTVTLAMFFNAEGSPAAAGQVIEVETIPQADTTEA